jgi:hypothetical protein
VTALEIVEVFDVVCNDDMGCHAITVTDEHWLLECDDERKVKIALSLDTYPFTDKEKMNAILDIVARKFPSTKARCAELIASRS